MRSSSKVTGLLKVDFRLRFGIRIGFWGRVARMVLSFDVVDYIGMGVRLADEDVVPADIGRARESESCKGESGESDRIEQLHDFGSSDVFGWRDVQWPYSWKERPVK